MAARLCIRIPSKTFLIGEYLALDGGPAVVLNTRPQFQVEIQICGEGTSTSVHPSSPAGQWIRKNREAFAGLSVRLLDPHAGQGGFGASTAEFIAVYVWSRMAQSVGDLLQADRWSADCLRAYQELHSSQPRPPSGLDLLGQIGGQMALVGHPPYKNREMPWPFPEHGFALIRTGRKLATHQHLGALQGVDTSALRPFVMEAISSLESQEWEALLTSMAGFRSRQTKLGLVDAGTLNLIEEIETMDPDLFARGCGAMGMDVILCLYPRTKASLVRQIANSKSLEVVATEADLSSGLDVQWDFQAKAAEPVLGAEL